MGADPLMFIIRGRLPSSRADLGSSMVMMSVMWWTFARFLQAIDMLRVRASPSSFMLGLVYRWKLSPKTTMGRLGYFLHKSRTRISREKTFWSIPVGDRFTVDDGQRIDLPQQALEHPAGGHFVLHVQIGRASCRERVQIS